MKHFTILWDDAYTMGNRRYSQFKKEFVKVKDVETLMKSFYGDLILHIFEGLVFSIGEKNATIQIIVINDDGSINDQNNKDELVYNGQVVQFHTPSVKDNIFDIVKWSKYVKTGVLTDYDGYGVFVASLKNDCTSYEEFIEHAQVSNIKVNPSEYLKDYKLPDWATHVLWDLHD